METQQDNRLAVILTVVVVSRYQSSVGCVGVAPAGVLHVVAVRVGRTVLERLAREHAALLRRTRVFKVRPSRPPATHATTTNQIKLIQCKFTDKIKFKLIELIK